MITTQFYLLIYTLCIIKVGEVEIDMDKTAEKLLQIFGNSKLEIKDVNLRFLNICDTF